MYRKSVVWFMAGYAVRLLSGFVVLWLLNRLMIKADYGLYALVMTIVSISVMLLSNMPERIMLYKFPDVTDEGARDELRGLLLTWGLIVSIVIGVAVAIFLAMQYEGDIFSYGLICLALLIPIGAQRNTVVTWLRFKEEASKAIVYGNIVPPMVQVSAVVLAFLYPQYLGYLIVAFGLVLTTFFVVEQGFTFRLASTYITWKDLSYGLKMLLTKVTSIGGEKIGFFTVAYLLSTVQVAEYSVAFTFAALTMVGHQFFSYILTPRIKKLAVDDQYDDLLFEYRRNRMYAMLSGFAILFGLAALGQPVLGWIGDYEASYGLLLLIGAFMLVNISFGANGPFLMMLGSANQVLMIGITVLILTVVGTWFLTTWFGIWGAVLGFGVPLLIGNWLSELSIRQIKKVRLMDIWTTAFQVVLMIVIGGYLGGFFDKPALMVLMALMIPALVVGVIRGSQPRSTPETFPTG